VRGEEVVYFLTGCRGGGAGCFAYTQHQFYISHILTKKKREKNLAFSHF